MPYLSILISTECNTFCHWCARYLFRFVNVCVYVPVYFSISFCLLLDGHQCKPYWFISFFYLLFFYFVISSSPNQFTATITNRLRIQKHHVLHDKWSKQCVRARPFVCDYRRKKKSHTQQNHHRSNKVATNEKSQPTHNLDDFICTQSGKGPGIVYSLSQFVYTFYKLPNAQLNNSSTQN